MESTVIRIGGAAISGLSGYTWFISRAPMLNPSSIKSEFLVKTEFIGKYDGEAFYPDELKARVRQMLNIQYENVKIVGIAWLSPHSEASL